MRFIVQKLTRPFVQCVKPHAHTVHRTSEPPHPMMSQHTAVAVVIFAPFFCMETRCQTKCYRKKRSVLMCVDVCLRFQGENKEKEEKMWVIACVCLPSDAEILFFKADLRLGFIRLNNLLPQAFCFFYFYLLRCPQMFFFFFGSCLFLASLLFGPHL